MKNILYRLFGHREVNWRNLFTLAAILVMPVFGLSLLLLPPVIANFILAYVSWVVLLFYVVLFLYVLYDYAFPKK